MKKILLALLVIMTLALIPTMIFANETDETDEQNEEYEDEYAIIIIERKFLNITSKTTPEKIELIIDGKKYTTGYSTMKMDLYPIGVGFHKAVVKFFTKEEQFYEKQFGFVSKIGYLAYEDIFTDVGMIDEVSKEMKDEYPILKERLIVINISNETSIKIFKGLDGSKYAILNIDADISENEDELKILFRSVEIFLNLENNTIEEMKEALRILSGTVLAETTSEETTEAAMGTIAE